MFHWSVSLISRMYVVNTMLEHRQKHKKRLLFRLPMDQHIEDAGSSIRESQPKHPTESQHHKLFQLRRAPNATKTCQPSCGDLFFIESICSFCKGQFCARCFLNDTKIPNFLHSLNNSSSKLVPMFDIFPVHKLKIDS